MKERPLSSTIADSVILYTSIRCELIKSAHRNWSAAMIKSVIMMTADTLDGAGLPIAENSSNGYSKANFFTMLLVMPSWIMPVNPTLSTCANRNSVTGKSKLL